MPVMRGRPRALGIETAPSGCMSSHGQDSAPGLDARAIGRPMSGCVSGRMPGFLNCPTCIDIVESTDYPENVGFGRFSWE
jgi:hypothetical protein